MSQIIGNRDKKSNRKISVKLKTIFFAPLNKCYNKIGETREISRSTWPIKIKTKPDIHF